MFRFVWLFLWVGVTACSSLVPVPDVPAGAALDPQKAWADVLASFVDDKGRVDFVGLAKDPGKLQAYVNYVSSHGPKSTPKDYPDADAVLALYLNTYNALSMYNILLSDIPESLGGILRKAKFFYFKKFRIDGEEVSLYAYENDVIRKVGDERVHFALNCMSVGCPRLPKKPFTAEKLQSELKAVTAEFIGDSRHVQVDEKEKGLRLSEIFQFYREDFEKKAPSLNAYVNLHRDAQHQVPLEYDVDFLSYDWTVNRWPEAESPAQE